MKLPYGYVLIGKEIVIHEEKADVVRSIFDDYLAGASLGKIVDLLFKKGVVSPTGKVKWTRAAVDKLLANKKYIPLVGIKIYMDTQFEKARRCNVIYLHKDGWNDWFKYETMFYLSYSDEKGNTVELGSIKIGQIGMEQRTPDLPKTFETLTDSFFTLGQSEDYYENVKKLEHGELREDILTALRDIAYNLTIFEAVKQENVTRESLMRDLGSRIIREQFHRIANGGAKLTPFDISYKLPGQVGTDYQLEFHVVPDSNPPTNIHVLIGRNGVGKTHMLTSMIRCLSTGNQDGQYGK